MGQDKCSCAFKAQMIAKMRELRRKSHGQETEWVEHLLGDSAEADEQSLCCLLTALFYYGYCEECMVPVSEQARNTLAPLMSLPVM